MSVERLRALSIRAVIGGWGVVERPRLVRLNLDMDCEDPVPFELFARSRKIKHRVVYTVYGLLRCRKCFSCSRRKSLFWTGRAITEYHRAARTWFGTLTLSPDEHYLIDARAQARLGARGVSWQQLSAKEQFAERAKEIGVDMTTYIKRLRKGDVGDIDKGYPPHIKPQIRYLLIAEMHDSEHTSDELRGRPHYHMLIHEQVAGALVVGNAHSVLIAGLQDGEMERRYYKTRNGWKPGVFATDQAFIRREWKLGFTKFQLAESVHSAVYVCKYLTKALHVRVRPSQRYGVERPPPKEKQVLKNDACGPDPSGLV